MPASAQHSQPSGTHTQPYSDAQKKIETICPLKNSLGKLAVIQYMAQPWQCSLGVLATGR